MKVIDILNKISNGEEVKFRILSEGDRYELSNGCDLYNETLCEEVRWYIDENWLNEEVEIIEDNKIEKMDRELNCDDDTIRGLVASVNEIYKEIADKINEIIDYLNKEE